MSKPNNPKQNNTLAKEKEGTQLFKERRKNAELRLTRILDMLIEDKYTNEHCKSLGAQSPDDVFRHIQSSVERQQKDFKNLQDDVADTDRGKQSSYEVERLLNEVERLTITSSNSRSDPARKQKVRPSPIMTLNCQSNPEVHTKYTSSSPQGQKGISSARSATSLEHRHPRFPSPIEKPPASTLSISPSYKDLTHIPRKKQRDAVDSRRAEHNQDVTPDTDGQPSVTHSEHNALVSGESEGEDTDSESQEPDVLGIV